MPPPKTDSDFEEAQVLSKLEKNSTLLRRRCKILARVDPTPTSKKVMTIFGTRPEVIKLAPLIKELERNDEFTSTTVSSAQHRDMIYPFARLFGLSVDYDLDVMRDSQSLSSVCSCVLRDLDPILDEERPDLIIVQGDTTSAFAGAVAGFYHRVPVAHVEAGLRSGCESSPYPEEMNRRLITRLATYHFAPTAGNRDNLLRDGVKPEKIFVTGNTVVDAFQKVVQCDSFSERLREILRRTSGSRRIVLTTHRRESFGQRMVNNLRAIRTFVERHEDVSLIFPMHPNPNVIAAAEQVFSEHPRIVKTTPLEYTDFIKLLAESWIIVSDSGGVQEEAPSLGKPLLIIRTSTERPEAIESGFARLAGGSPDILMAMLEDAHQNGSWTESVLEADNPFGRGDASRTIVKILTDILVPRPWSRRSALDTGEL